jgi:hypothetical protein
MLEKENDKNGRLVSLVGLILDYLKSLIKKWYTWVFAILDIISIILLPRNGIYLQPWIYYLIFGVVFVIANFLVYRDLRNKIKELNEKAEQRLLNLNLRIAELEETHPKLDLLFNEGNGFSKTKKIFISDTSEVLNIEKELRRKNQELLTTYESHEPGEINGSKLKIIINQTPKDRKKYEAECRNYLKKYGNYLTEKSRLESFRARGVNLRFMVRNIGKVPANQVRFILHFPDVFDFFSDEELLFLEIGIEKSLEVPDPPNIYENFRDGLRANNGLFPYLPPIKSPTNNIPLRNVTGPSQTRDNGIKVTYEVKTLIHNFGEDDIKEVVLMVRDEAIGHIWEIPYEIHAANLPEPEEGFLFLEVQIG